MQQLLAEEDRHAQTGTQKLPHPKNLSQIGLLSADGEETPDAAAAPAEGKPEETKEAKVEAKTDDKPPDAKPDAKAGEKAKPKGKSKDSKKAKGTPGVPNIGSMLKFSKEDHDRLTNDHIN